MRSARLVLIVLVSGAAAAQAQRPDYSRADRFLQWNTSRMIAGDSVRPQWFDDGIPDKRAGLVYNEGAPSSSPDALPPKPTGTWQDEIKVYRWVSAGS